MSGGHFDYQQYHIEDIADSIEREIEEATKPKPSLVWKEEVSVFKKIDDWHSIGIYMGFKTYNEAVRHLKKDKAYKFVREYEKDGKRISEFTDGSELIEVKEIRYQEYEDGEYHPEYTEETIQIFKDAVKILRKAAIYANRIDWLLSGDDGEESLKERLEEELKKIGGGSMNDSRKDDRKDNKPMWELLPLSDLEDVVKVYTFGAKKYAPNSWRNLPDGMERYKAALLRHLVAFDKGEEFDEESQLPALAHMAWNAIAMLAIWHDKMKTMKEKELRHNEFDNYNYDEAIWNLNQEYVQHVSSRKSCSL